MKPFRNAQFAVVNQENEIAPGPGGDGYALYKTRKHAETKASRWRPDWYRVVRIGFEEIEED